MDQVLSWLNANSSAVTAVATILLVVITARYVWLTGRLVKENRELRMASNRPDIGISIGLHEAHINIINLLIENIGNGPAYNVRLVADRPFKVHGDRDINDVGPFKSGLALLARGQRMEIFIENAIGNYDRLKHEHFAIEATWADATGSTYERRFDIRFDEYNNVTRIGTPPLYSIASNLEKLQKAATQIASGHSRVKVISETASQALLREGAELTWARFRSLPADEQKEIGALIKSKANKPSPDSATGSTDPAD